MSRDLRNGESNLFGAARLSQGESAPEMQWNTSTQIRQRKGRLAIAAVGRPNQIEQNFVLRNGKQLSLAKHPASRCEVAREHSDFSHVRLGHSVSLALRRE